MTPERAHEINAALVAHSMYDMGLRDSPPPSLAEISLEDMTAATMNQRILRVFPRRTSATPTDSMVRCQIVNGRHTGRGFPPPPDAPRIECSQVHVSVAFTWDRTLAEMMRDEWRRAGYSACVGGPAYGHRGGEFVPGLYVRTGHVITSRGCPNRCPNCLVPEREGPLRTLRVTTGWNVLDNNLLACPQPHVRNVVEMLSRQKHAAEFTGGIEAARLIRPQNRWFVHAVTRGMRLKVLFLAYDRPGERDAVERAAKMLMESGGWAPGTTRKKLMCYVLAGFDGDDVGQAERRFEFVKGLGITPFPMWFKAATDDKDQRVEAMKRALRKWMRPASIWSKAPSQSIENALE